MECQNTIGVLENQLDDYLKKLKSCEKTIKKFEESQKQLEETLAAEISFRSELERQYDEQYKKNQELINITERQTEELEMLQTSSQPFSPSSHTHQREPSSLQLELEELGEAEEIHFPDPAQSTPAIRLLDPKKCFNIDLRKSISIDIRKSLSLDLKKSFKMAPRTLGNHRQEQIHIKAQNARKSPSEEYFFLATQAMKLNSVYIDTICTVSPKSLYQTAIKNQIPFHKWHTWIEQQLNASYLTAIYKRELKVSKLN